ncbi:hypothetical protein [Streptomyces griseus]|uniref:hypothetical protein n=1 Tax=Streptomyces griseus TaxID=1911 RepID=UPI000A3920DB|nr:hypothetical protein [Streptomyces fimicarius]
MTTLAPPHRQYSFPAVSLADIEWHMRRAHVRSVVGDDLGPLAHRAGLTPEAALDLLTAGPRWLLDGRTTP